jgi:acetolactate synthase-1/2/3 large subunit/sulfoacetaldehyde acetyltransferase
MNGGNQVVEALRAVGANTVFGLLGSSTMEVYDALYDAADIRYIGVRDEAAGTHMADAYGRISGQPGIILAGQAGPGATNLVTGLVQAKLAYSPLVAITGLASTEHLGRDTFQEVDQQSIFSAITKRTFTVPRAERIGDFIYEAYRLANAGQRGPVVVQVPRDFFAQETASIKPQQKGLKAPATGVPDKATLAAIREMIAAAKRPVIMAGAGVKWSRGSAALEQFAQLLGIPVTVSAGHTDVIRNDHPFFFGQVGPRGNPLASRLVRESDLILALGTRLGFNTTFYNNDVVAKGTAIVQVDIDPFAIGRHFPVALGYVGDAGAAIMALTEVCRDLTPERRKWSAAYSGLSAERDELWQKREKLGADNKMPMSAERVFAELRRAMPRNAIVTLDAGTLCLQASDQLRYYEPPALLTPLDFGLVGFSYAAGLGAKLAAPERPVVTLMGDGGFGMTMAEISTAVEHRINTVAVVLDNGSWGAEKAYQRDFYDGRYIGADIKSPPYDKVAELMGASGFAITQPGQLENVFREALAANAPAVIHVKVDPNALVSFRRDSFKHRAPKA